MRRVEALLQEQVEERLARGPLVEAVLLAANTPMLLKAGLVEGRVDAGVLASGQVVGVIEDLPSCEELIDRIVTEAVCQVTTAGRLLA